MASFKVGIKTTLDRDWTFNSLRFPTEEVAVNYGLDLSARWMHINKWEVFPSEDRPNAFFPERRRARRESSVSAGYSLIELLAVIGIIMMLVGATIIATQIGMWQAREASARESLRAILHAETEYFQQYNTYTVRLDDLGPNGIKAIPPDLAAGDKQRYRFGIWPCGPSFSGQITCFRAYAIPPRVRFAGKRLLCLDDRGSQQCH